jgi:chromosome segregation ATPase
MAAIPSLEERVSAVEDTLRGLITSVPLPGAQFRNLHKDVGVVKHDAAVLRQGILELSVEMSEVQATLRTHDTKFHEVQATLQAHDTKFDEVQATLQAHDTKFHEVQATLQAHDTKFHEVQATLGDHGRMLAEFGDTLKAILGRLSAG